MTIKIKREEKQEEPKLETKATTIKNLVTTETEEGQEFLRQVSTEVDTIMAKDIANELLTAMNAEDKALGLAAPQIGYTKRLFAMRVGTDTCNDITEAQVIVCVNPKIKKIYDKKVIYKESCFSEPNKVAFKERAKVIKVSYETLEGKTITTTFSNNDAIVFQHEYDHLEGILMIDNAIRVNDI